MGCHEENGDTGTEEVNSDAEVARDDHQVIEDTRGEHPERT